MEDEDSRDIDFAVLPQTREKTESLLVEKFQQAISSLAQRNYPEGIKSLKELLENEIVSEELHELRYQCVYNLAVVYEELRSLRDALIYYYKCVSMKENDFNIWLKLSNYCLRLHYFEQAEHCYQNCVKYIPTSFYENMIYEKMVFTSFLSKNYSAAQQRIDYLLSKNYKTPELILLRGIVAREKGNPSEYEKYKKEALQLDPTIIEENLTVSQILASQPEELPPLDENTKEVGAEKEHIKEITITIDKYSWEIFLKKLKNILKTCFLLSEDLTMSKKLKKNNPLKSIMSGEAEEYQTIMSSLFRIKDKKEKGSGKHLKVQSPKLDMCLSPGSQDERGDDEGITMVEKKEPSNDFILHE